MAASVAEAARAEPDLKKIVRVVEVPERFVAGEGGALVNAVNGKVPLPPGKRKRAAESGVDGQPTLLSNAETFAQLAVLAMLGEEGYASDGTPDEPGTVLLTVGGSANRPGRGGGAARGPAGHRAGRLRGHRAGRRAGRRLPRDVDAR